MNGCDRSDAGGYVRGVVRVPDRAGVGEEGHTGNGLCSSMLRRAQTYPPIRKSPRDRLHFLIPVVPRVR